MTQEQRDDARYEAIMIVNELHKTIDYSVYSRLIDLIDMLGLPAETCMAEPPKSARPEAVSPTTQLDANGLVPCGCGGKAEIVRAIEYWDWIAQNKVEVKKVQCDKCYVSTPGSVTNEYAMQKWNAAMSGGACSHEN